MNLVIGGQRFEDRPRAHGEPVPCPCRHDRGHKEHSWRCCVRCQKAISDCVMTGLRAIMATVPDYPKRVEEFELNQVEDGFVVYQAERDRVHYLNHTAALVLELCNGRLTAEQIAKTVQKAFGLAEPPFQEVEAALTQLRAESLTH